MSVYVDHARIPFRRMLMSHMVADSLDELHAMARSLDLKPEWFQGPPCDPHYDVCEATRGKAITLGAIPVSGRQIIDVIRRHRPE